MMGKKKWTILVFLLTGILLAATQSASQAEIEMTIATFHPRTGTADVEGLYHFKKLVEERSNGEIKVAVFFGGTLGGERELVEQLKLGTVHLCLGGWGTRGAYIKDITGGILPPIRCWPSTLRRRCINWIPTCRR